MKKDRVKKQHIVPQFYLRNFASEKELLFVFDKQTQRTYPAQVKDVAQERCFYDLPDACFAPDSPENHDPQVVEHYLAEREQKISATLRLFLETADMGLIHDEDRLMLAYFMALQVVRAKEFRTTMMQVPKQVIKLLEKDSPGCTAPGTQLNKQLFIEDHELRLVHARCILDEVFMAKIAAPLLEHIWCIGVNASSTPLYSSDNPLVRSPHYEHPVKSMSGLASPGIEIAFPFSPRIILILFDRGAFGANDGTVLPLDTDNVTYYNAMQVNQSYRQIYSVGHDFELAEDVCRRNPGLCNVERIRFEINPGRQNKRDSQSRQW